MMQSKMIGVDKIDFSDWEIKANISGSTMNELFTSVTKSVFKNVEFYGYFSESSAYPLDLIVSMPMDESVYNGNAPRLTFDIKHIMKEIIEQCKELYGESPCNDKVYYSYLHALKTELLCMTSEVERAMFEMRSSHDQTN